MIDHHAVGTVAHRRFTRSRFADRHEAGRLLADELERTGTLVSSEPTIVVGLARGGVDVASQVAARFAVPLDALAVRKVGHPWQPEYAIGAVAPGGVHYIRGRDGLTDAQIVDVVRAAVDSAEMLEERLHMRAARIPVAGKTCVLVDDGLATGATMIAAVRWARSQGAIRVVVAVPIGAASTAQLLERDPAIDAFVCLATPRGFAAVGRWYEDFSQVSDEDVRTLLERARANEIVWRTDEIPIGGIRLVADLMIPAHATGCAIFADGSGSSRLSTRNRRVAAELNEAGIATLLFDLLTDREEREHRNVFDIGLLCRRLIAATRWLAAQPEARNLPLGYFGASTGAAAALLAAAQLGDHIGAVVSRGGRPDLAGDALGRVRTPTLLIAGSADVAGLELNRAAVQRLAGQRELAVVPGATHLFEEPGALEQVASLAGAWFVTYLPASRAGRLTA